MTVTAVVDRSKNRTNGARGASFERKVADLLESDGYLVIRAAGSHGAADLVALKLGQVLFVQCKLNGRCDPPADRAEGRGGQAFARCVMVAG
jgi:hypothetical protein